MNPEHQKAFLARLSIERSSTRWGTWIRLFNCGKAWKKMSKPEKQTFIDVLQEDVDNSQT